ncbi:MAG: fibronectin type III domain-containing protein [Bacteroidales bacterium]|nr:fibronectin type III domain-containing protein [Bacteroidales bacterium]
MSFNTARSEPDPVEPFAPTGLRATAVSNTQINLSWVAVTNATGYSVERRTGSESWAVIATSVTSTTYNNSGLTANTHYYYRVRAYNAAGNSEYSDAVSATASLTTPATPTGLRATTVSSTQINLSWTAVTGATGYRIERSLNGGSGWAEIYSGTSNSYNNDTGLAAGTRYYYRVRAYNGIYNSGYSSVANATTTSTSSVTIAAPTNLRVTVSPLAGQTAYRATVSWNGVSGATSYELEYSTNGTSNWIVVYSETSTSYTYNNIPEGNKYYFRVRAHKGINSSGYSNIATTVPAAPTGLTTTTVLNNRIDIKWNAVTGATGYKIEINDGGGWTLKTSVTTTNYQSTGLTVNKKYLYRVSAYNISGDSDYSDELETATPTAAPTGLTATIISNERIDLVWNTVVGATGYKLERSLNGTSWTVIDGAVTDTKYWNNLLAANTKYYYRVRACNAGGDSEYSTTVSATTAPAIPTGLSVTSKAMVENPLKYEAAIKWNTVTGATGYKVERSINDGSWAEIAPSVTTTTYTDSNLEPNTKYSYRVRSYNGNGDESDYPVAASATTAIDAPAGLSATAVSNTQINLSWTAVTGATGYRVERSPNGTSNWTQIIASVTATTYNNTGLAAGTIYYYRVRAHNASGSNSAFSTIENATTETVTITLDAPTGLTTTTVLNNRIDLKWNAVTGATGYRVERKIDTGEWTQIASSVTGTTYQNTGLTGIHTYYYRVRAYNNSGDSEYSNETSATTRLSVPGITTTVVSSTQINLSWAAITDATGYRVERSPDGMSGWTEIYSGTAISYNNTTGLTANTEYYYRVQAFDGAGHESVWSSVSATTAPAAPTGLEATAVSSTAINLTWTAINGLNYKVERSTNGTSWTEIAQSVPTGNYQNTGLTAKTTYYYRVRAYNGVNSEPSDVDSATTE